MVAVGVEGGAEIPDRGGVQLAVFVGQPHHLVAGELDGPGLVAVDMAGGCCHNTLPPVQHRRNDDGIRLGTAGDERHVRFRAPACRADLCLRAGAVGVGAVAGHLLEVRFHQLLQNGRMGTFAVIVLKIKHFPSSSLLKVPLL